MPASDHLPLTVSDEKIQSLLEDLGLPKSETIKPLRAIAEFHGIYRMDFKPVDLQSLAPSESPILILRVSGTHMPKVKTENEVGAMTWVKQNCPSVPVPTVVRWDASTNNAIGAEFTLLEWVSVGSEYSNLGNDEKEALVGQLADMVEELHGAGNWNGVCGLKLKDGDVVPGSFIDETMWFAPDVVRFWSEEESMDSLSASGVFDGHAAWTIANLEKYMYGICKHPSLEFMQDLLPRLEELIKTVIPRHTEELNDARYLFTHRDLHFENMLYDPKTGKITAILDWEFAAVVPAFLWNQGNPFLWSGKRSPESRADQGKLMNQFRDIVKERNYTCLDKTIPNGAQTMLHDVVRFVRAIVEVSPRSEKKDAALEWKKVAEENIAKLELY